MAALKKKKQKKVLIKKKIKITVKPKTAKKKVASKKKSTFRADIKTRIKSKVKNKTKKLTKKTIQERVKKVIRKIVKRHSIKSRKEVSLLELSKAPQNPIITPTAYAWESKATFNPTAIYHDGKVHIIYRAIGDSDNSVLGYANSKDGFTISEGFPRPVYYHFIRQNKEQSVSPISYVSGGGWGGGSEDPRLTLLDGRIYMLYTAFDGWGSVRIALTSISLEDFIDKCWNWKEPVLISPPGEIHKNWVLFPEKIKGRYAILHAISPKIMINYFKSLDELNGINFIHSIHQGSPLWSRRDRLTRGVGPSPIKTKYGWLVLYHKMEKHDDHRYKLWAMILDAKDPTKVLYNSKQPILEPEEWYENEGYKAGVIYSCGAVVKDGKLFVYYGGADKVSCVATADLDRFLKELIHSKTPVLRPKKS